jgi:hypothetical protein
LQKKRRKKPFTVLTLEAFKKKYDNHPKPPDSNYIKYGFSKQFNEYLMVCKMCKKETTKVMVPYNRRIFINQEFYWSYAAFDWSVYPFPNTLRAFLTGRTTPQPKNKQEEQEQFEQAKALWWADLVKGSYVHPMCSETCVNVMILMNQV